jgi:hypothetical protein
MPARRSVVVVSAVDLVGSQVYRRRLIRAGFMLINRSRSANQKVKIEMT